MLTRILSGIAVTTTLYAAPPEHRVVTLSSLCLLDGVDHRRRDYVVEALAGACARVSPDLIVTPDIPFITVREGHPQEDLAPFAELAKKHRTYVAISVREEAGGRRFATSFLLDRTGRIAYKWRKTHALADDAVALGNTLEVFRTDFGTVAATIGTDIYFPEIYEVLRMKGAEILIWHHAPERFREHHGWDPMLTARAFDSHCHFIAAHYADPRPYITNRYARGMQGAAFGRSMILNRVGVPIADTGYEDGVATAVVDLDKRKQNPYKGWEKDENCFYVNILADRTAFLPVAEPWRPPTLPRYTKRKARVAVIAQDDSTIWRDGQLPTRLFELLEEAAAAKPDIVLASEQAASEDDPVTKKGFEMVAKLARKMSAYICIGGLRNKDFMSVARLWDRSGKLVFGQPIYWTKGFDTIEFIDTDFARISTHTCGDLFAPFFDRTLALHGVDLILDPSQMWGPCGRTNESLLRARAQDNATWIACAHWNSSDPGLRSLVVDPYGQVVAASQVQQEGVIVYDIDFSVKRVYYEGRKSQQPTRGQDGIPSYYTEDVPEQKPGWRSMIFSRRRPELYGIIPTTNDVIMKYRPEKMP